MKSIEQRLDKLRDPEYLLHSLRASELHVYADAWERDRQRLERETRRRREIDDEAYQYSEQIERLRAERDKLREALREIACSGPESRCHFLANQALAATEKRDD